MESRRDVDKVKDVLDIEGNPLANYRDVLFAVSSPFLYKLLKCYMYPRYGTFVVWHTLLHYLSRGVISIVSVESYFCTYNDIHYLYRKRLC